MARIPFPFNGLVEAVAAMDQAVGGSFSLQNVRLFDTTKERMRGGQRPGTSLAYTTRIVGDFPIIAMTEIVTTYIQPA